MIWLLALAQLSAPEPVNPNWFRPQDTPTKIMPENTVQAVRIGLTINPAGQIQDCKVEVSSGNPQLDRHTCGILQRRARFRPARISGEPAYGIYRTSVSWWVGDGFPPASVELPDLEVAVSTLPPKTKSPITLRVMHVVDALGQILGCEAEGKKDDPELVVLACDRLRQNNGTRPAQTPDGSAVSSVQTSTVLFRTN